VHGNEAGTSVKICRPSETSDWKRFPGESQHGCCAEGDHELWVDELQFLVQPPSIMLDLAGRRFLMNAALSALLELEVLDGIGDVDPTPIEPCI